MRSLGIDYGRRRIGLALSDPTMFISSPLDIIENKGIKKTVARIMDIVVKNDVGLIVMGLPFSVDGSENEMCREVRTFAEALQNNGLPIEFIDERYTSFEAEQLIGDNRRKDLIDKVAASIILQMYLDKRRNIK